MDKEQHAAQTPDLPEKPREPLNNIRARAAGSATCYYMRFCAKRNPAIILTTGRTGRSERIIAMPACCLLVPVLCRLAGKVNSYVNTLLLR
jgi:hypothetical protein